MATTFASDALAASSHCLAGKPRTLSDDLLGPRIRRASFKDASHINDPSLEPRIRLSS
ncbi:hypothetical protein PAXINDRAFT_103954 [Paxillus involutus ATCC 200175]|uniref:Uncharacterized protein n=1 Tax=Paxillus involutus ATCC 200175 TaxID=664439 RepID=A0A0C9T0H0_PAXIN|nr:hypothetical protein PAXINDRAFT_103954 [Paxillus involutus ATCC 200175]